jgi:ribosome-binding factor A
MTTEVKRSQRVSGRLHEEVALCLRTLNDPRISGVVVTRVEVTDDLSFVRVFVRRDVGSDERARRALLQGLDKASGRIRRDVTRAVGLRVAPGFRFLYDEGIDAAQRVEELLHEIEVERQGSE